MVSLSSSTSGGFGCDVLFTLCLDRSTIFEKDASTDIECGACGSTGGRRSNTGGLRSNLTEYNTGDDSGLYCKCLLALRRYQPHAMPLAASVCGRLVSLYLVD
jgi:hypothetical protein